MDDRLQEVRRLVHEHLSAAMIMVRLDDPLDPEMPIADALAYLDANEFDLALLGGDDLRIVYRDVLSKANDLAHSQPVEAQWSSPRADRLVDHSVALGEVARRLQNDEVPLLVVGHAGPEFIITRADFTRPAGLAGVLGVIAALDAQLDELLGPLDEEAWPLLPADRREKIDVYVERAHRRSEEVHRLSYLMLGERFMLVRALELGRRLTADLGVEAEHVRVTRVRNAIAHGRPVQSGTEVIAALAIAERILDSVDGVLSGRSEH
jgi:hypothetical protein